MKITKDDVVSWSCMIAAVLCALYHAGCEVSNAREPGYYGDQELVALAQDIRPDPPMAIDVVWGDESMNLPRLVQINRAERGGKWVRKHMEHELTGLWVVRHAWVDDPQALAQWHEDHRINGG